MLWLCLHCWRLPLDLLQRRGLDMSLPRAVCEGSEQRRRIVFANETAQRLGVRLGQSVAAARALVPELQVHPRVPSQEQAALERLAAVSYGFSAAVAIAPPQVVLLEAGASRRLFGGIETLLARVRSELGGLGLIARMSSAPTAAAAELLALAGEETTLNESAQLTPALSHIALTHTPLPDETIEGLARVGMRSVGDLAKLPRVALARRFREETVDYLDRLFGHATDPRPRWLPPPRFESGIELPAAFHQVEPLLFPLRRLIVELAATLAARDGGVQRFVMRLGHEDCAASEITVGLVEPTREPNHLFELARERLERAVLPAPVTHLGVLAAELPPFVPRGADLFDTATRETLPLPRLLERLRARLGADAVRALRTYPDHRPERASRMDPDFALADAPAGYAAARMLRESRVGLGPPCAELSESRAASLAGLDPPSDRPHAQSVEAVGQGPSYISSSVVRPCWLLDAPAPIDPEQFRVLAGPERIESGWWDEADVARDYYLAARTDGAMGWIFHERRAPHGWYVHGWFG